MSSRRLFPFPLSTVPLSQDARSLKANRLRRNVHRDTLEAAAGLAPGDVFLLENDRLNTTPEGWIALHNFVIALAEAELAVRNIPTTTPTPGL